MKGKQTTVQCTARTAWSLLLLPPLFSKQNKKRFVSLFPFLLFFTYPYSDDFLK